MFPVLIHVGFISIYSISIFLLIAWVIFSFLFWKSLRNLALDEEKIFSLMFYGTLMGFFLARLFYAVTHWSLFSATILRIFTIWIEPGLSLYGALIGFIVTVVYLSRLYELRVGPIVDAFTKAFSVSFCIGAIGVFFDGSTIGLQTGFIWGVIYQGHAGFRHPIQLYECLGVVLLYIVLSFIRRKQRGYFQHHIGMFAVWYFLVFSVLMFFLEFLKDGSVYLSSLTINQWVLVAIGCEAIGMLFVRGGGRGALRRIYGFFQKRFKRKSTGTA